LSNSQNRVSFVINSVDVDTSGFQRIPFGRRSCIEVGTSEAIGQRSSIVAWNAGVRRTAPSTVGVMDTLIGNS
jgi:hypothetical protein